MQMPLRCPSPFRRTATRSPSATMKHRPTRPTTSCSRSPRRATASLDCGSALCLGPGTDRERRCPRPWGLRLSPDVQGWSTSAEQLGPPILLPRCVLLIANKASSSEQPPWPHRGSRGRRGAAASPARVCVRARVCAGATERSSDGRCPLWRLRSLPVWAGRSQDGRPGGGVTSVALPRPPPRGRKFRRSAAGPGATRRRPDRRCGTGRDWTGPPGREGEGRSYHGHRDMGGRRFRAVVP